VQVMRDAGAVVIDPIEIPSFDQLPDAQIAATVSWPQRVLVDVCRARSAVHRTTPAAQRRDMAGWTRRRLRSGGIFRPPDDLITSPRLRAGPGQPSPDIAVTRGDTL